jgi:hypothetical protein
MISLLLRESISRKRSNALLLSMDSRVAAAFRSGMWLITEAAPAVVPPSAWVSLISQAPISALYAML